MPRRVPGAWAWRTMATMPVSDRRAKRASTDVGAGGKRRVAMEARARSRRVIGCLEVGTPRASSLTARFFAQEKERILEGARPCGRERDSRNERHRVPDGASLVTSAQTRGAWIETNKQITSHRPADPLGEPSHFASGLSERATCLRAADPALRSANPSTGSASSYAPATSPRLHRSPSPWPPGRRHQPAKEFPARPGPIRCARHEGTRAPRRRLDAQGEFLPSEHRPSRPCAAPRAFQTASPCPRRSAGRRRGPRAATARCG